MNIENETDDFLNNIKTEETSSVINKIPETEITPYTLWIKNELEPYVSKVVISKRLTDTPILITSQVSNTMKTMMAMMQQEKDTTLKDYTVEINPSHKIIVGINRLRKEDPKLAHITIKQLFETALLQSNLPISNKEYVKRTFSILDLIVEKKPESHNIEEPKMERLSSEYYN